MIIVALHDKNHTCGFTLRCGVFNLVGQYAFTVGDTVQDVARCLHPYVSTSNDIFSWYGIGSLLATTALGT